MRIALVWPVANALVEENYGLALVLFVVAAVSDGLDGYLAKRFGWTSQLGKVIDPLEILKVVSHGNRVMRTTLYTIGIGAGETNVMLRELAGRNWGEFRDVQE